MIALLYAKNIEDDPKAILFNNRVEVAKYLVQNGKPPNCVVVTFEDVDASRISGWVKATS